jgi:drug/metabolite transporter (DMT)-like permease
LSDVDDPMTASGNPRVDGDPAKAVAYMLAAVASLAVLDAAVKWLTDDYPVPQIAFIRYVIGLALALGLAGISTGGLASLRTRRLGGHLLRSVFNLSAMLVFYYALWLLPLAEAVAIAFATPIFTTMLSIPLLRERVSPRRWAAVGVGFAGVLVMVRPSALGVEPGVLLALLSAVLFAMVVTTSRQLTRTEASHTILFYYSIACLIGTGAMLPWYWVTPAPGDLAAFLIVGVTGSFGQYLMNQALRYGEASMLAPLDYTALLWAALFGYMLWGDWPSLWVVGGAALVLLSTIIATSRGGLLRKRQSASAE